MAGVPERLGVTSLNLRVTAIAAPFTDIICMVILVLCRADHNGPAVTTIIRKW